MNTNTPPCIHIIAHALFSSLIIKINKISSHFYIMHACVFLCIYLPPQAKLQALLSWRLIRIEEIPYHFYIMNAWMYNKYVYVCTHDAHTWVCMCVSRCLYTRPHTRQSTAFELHTMRSSSIYEKAWIFYIHTSMKI